MTELEQKLRQFVIDNFLFGDSKGLRNNSSFLDQGVIDSTGMLELVTYVEETFSIHVEDSELVPENLDSIDQLVNFIQRKTAKLQTENTASAS